MVLKIREGQISIHRNKEGNIDAILQAEEMPKKFYINQIVNKAEKNVIHAILLNRLKKYIEAVIKEIRYANLSKYRIKTVYIGGGTPSIIDSRYISKIINEIKPYIDADAEITIECNR